jgi:hypothetical protein
MNAIVKIIKGKSAEKQLPEKKKKKKKSEENRIPERNPKTGLPEYR